MITSTFQQLAPDEAGRLRPGSGTGASAALLGGWRRGGGASPQLPCYLIRVCVLQVRGASGAVDFKPAALARAVHPGHHTAHCISAGNVVRSDQGLDPKSTNVQRRQQLGAKPDRLRQRGLRRLVARKRRAAVLAAACPKHHKPEVQS